MADRDAQKMLSTANKLLDGLDAAAKAANQKTAEASAKALNEKLGAAHAGLPNGLVDKGYNPRKFQRTAVDSESDARACVEQLRNQGFDAVYVEHRGEYVIEVSNVPTAYDNYYQQHSSSNQSLLLQAAQQNNTPDLPYMNPC